MILKLLVALLLCFQRTNASAAASAAIKGLGSIDYRFFVAGGVCAATSHGITTPIDVVKTKIQANPEVYNKGMLDATLQILKSEGPGTLLGGLGPTVVGYGIEGALKFGIYEVLKPVMIKILSDQTTSFLASAVIAGAVASIILCPMESIRIRLVTDASYKGCNFLTGLMKLLQSEGLLSTFGGIWAMLSKQVPYTMAKQVSFDLVAASIYLLFSTFEIEDVKFIVSLVSAFVASIIACLLSQPGDMILTLTYKGDKDKSFLDIINDIINSQGLKGFFIGTKARILHVGLIITTQLMIYDIVKQLLGLPA